MKPFQIIVCLLVILALSLTACGSEPSPTSEPEPTATAEAVGGLTDPVQATIEATKLRPPTFTPTPSPEPTATNTLVPTVTPLPTATLTPTPTPEPVARVKQNGSNINVRAGPGTNYPVAAQFEPGQTAVVNGRNEDSSWWQVRLTGTTNPEATGWVLAELVALEGEAGQIAVVEAPPTPTPDTAAQVETVTNEGDTDDDDDDPKTPEELAEALRCGQDFCVTFQDMLSIGENGGCVGNHSIYITVLQGLPPGQPMDGVVIGDTFNNVEVASGSHGPGRTEITLWNNSMTLTAKRHIDGSPYTSEESFNFTAADELIPAEVLAAKGYCDGSVDKCRWAQQNNQVCRGHYSWRVTFHKFD